MESGSDKGCKVLLLGAGFDTENLGVEALAIGSIQIITAHWPEAQVQLLDYGKSREHYSVEISGKKIDLEKINIRFSKNIALKNHILFLMICGVIVRTFPALRSQIRRWNPYYREIENGTVAFAISGGDSFSDIYGLERYFYVTLPQLLMLIMKKRLILLPQTFGPYHSWISRCVTRYVLRKAESVYCRDHNSIATIRKLFGGEMQNVGFCHDVAFGLRPAKRTDTGDQRGGEPSPIVGFNVSGLLYYDRANRFHLKCEYRHLVDQILDYFCTTLGQKVLLVPHVIGIEEGSESDVLAIAELKRQCQGKYGDRLLFAEGITGAPQAKEVIGRCEFFLGSRMHACIGALSQGIPAVGLAYSGKFGGLFATVGVGGLVLDMTQLAETELIKGIASHYEKRGEWQKVLRSKLSTVEESYQRMGGTKAGGMLSA